MSPFEKRLRNHLRGVGLGYCLLSAAALWGERVSALDCPVLSVNEAAPVSVRFAHGLLFSVSDGNAPVSHVFGTIHVTDPGNPGIPAPIVAAIDASERFVMETVIDIAAMTSLAQQMFFSDGGTLAGAVGAELAGRAAVLLRNHGVPEIAAVNMKPWAAFTTLSMPSGPQGLPLDMLLMQHAQERGLEILGLEALEEQTRIFTGLSDAEQRELLTQAVCFYDTAQLDMQILMKLYEDRDLAGMLHQSTRYQTDPPDLQERFIDALLYQRNDRMLERMLPLIDRGAAFIAVGALHLAGPEGLLERLVQHGYRVEAVY